MVISDIAEKISDSFEANSECQNLEQMMRGIREANSEIKNLDKDAKITIGSMDAVSLYPNLKLEEVLQICLEMVIKSKIKFASVNWKEISKYLRIKMTKEEVMKAGINQFLPVRYTSRGKPSIKYLEHDVIISKSVSMTSSNRQEDTRTDLPPGRKRRFDPEIESDDEKQDVDVDDADEDD